MATTGSKKVYESKEPDKKPDVPPHGEKNTDKISGLISLLLLLLLLWLSCSLRRVSGELLYIGLIGWIESLSRGSNIGGMVKHRIGAGNGEAGELPRSSVHAKRRDKEGMRSAGRRKKIDGTGGRSRWRSLNGILF